MIFRLTSYGLPQMVVGPLILLVIGLAIPFCWDFGAVLPWVVASPILILAYGALAFFRDPHREVPAEKNILVAPADGKVTDIGPVETCEFIDGPAVRIGIFLSVLDVHINRVPCAGKVVYAKEHPGKCINALHWREASEQNQAYCIGLDCGEHPVGKVMVKQITGLIARRIVCKACEGQELAAGEKYGMIKFGSRTELFIPAGDVADIVVKEGDIVRAGTSVLVKY